MKTKDKQAKQPSQQRPGLQRSPACRPWSRRLLLGVTLVVVAAGVWALFEFVIWNRLPANLVGKWVVVGGLQDGATFDFHRNGTMVGRVNLGGKEGIINASVRVEGVKIYATTKHPRTGQDDTRIQIIRTLTPTELVVEDEQGKRLAMERAE